MSRSSSSISPESSTARSMMRSCDDEPGVVESGKYGDVQGRAPMHALKQRFVLGLRALQPVTDPGQHVRGNAAQMERRFTAPHLDVVTADRDCRAVDQAGAA